MTNPVFIEGISGACKSASAKALAEKLCEMGYNIAYYLDIID